MKELLISKMIKVGALKFGKFKLSSGRESNVYVDIKLASTYPDLLEIISSMLCEIAKKYEFDKIACIELGGVPIAVATSLKLKKPLVIFRKEIKGHGVRSDRIGEIKFAERILIIEDVVTTGKSVTSIVKRVKDAGGMVAGIIAVVDREEGDVSVESLVKLKELIDAYNFTNTSKTLKS